MPPVNSRTSGPRVVVIDDWDGIAERSPSIARLRELVEVTVLGRSSED
jgi:hypothetical protein